VENFDVVASIKRTLVPIWAAVVVAQAARVGIDLPGDAVSDIILAVVASAYYSSVRVLEVRYPQLSVLLGDRRLPFYYQVESNGDA
jgi:hypothetical protein